MKVFVDNVYADGEPRGLIYIESDACGYQVKTYSNKVDKNGNPIVLDTKYFVTISGCIKHVLNMKFKESTAATLRELLEDIARIETYIQSKIAV